MSNSHAKQNESTNTRKTLNTAGKAHHPAILSCAGKAKFFSVKVILRNS
jgi:hypothetical protein